MAELTIHNINFSDINTSQKVISNTFKNTKSQFVTNNLVDTTKISNIMTAVNNGNTEWSNMAFINAIDIDWNGAQLKNGSTVKATLNTTGEMLSILQTAYNYATTYNVKYNDSDKKLYDDKNNVIKVGSDYTLPTATSTVLGGVKVGTGLNISSGVLSIKSEYITESKLASKSYITTSAADGKYAYKSHQHSQYADRDHNHASYYAPISHASTATKYGVGTDANYGHLKISGAYTTRTSSADTALSLGAAYNLYTAFVTRISELTAEIATLNSRVATLEGHHTTKLVTLVDVQQSEYTFYGKDQTVKLTYSITPEDATNKSVSWSSSNETYVSVDSEGVVRYDALTTDVDNGYVIITATANDGSGKYDQCKVYVEEARITGMHVNTSTIEAEYAYNGTISAITVTQDINHGDGAVFNEGFTYTYTGRSVTVDSNTGVITILSTGTSYVNITSNADNTKSVQVTVNIIKGTNTITIKEGNNTVGDTLTKSYGTSPIKLTATTKSGATVTWRSSNTSVATISGDGTITLKDAGTTTITATVDSSELYKSATKTITLNVTSVTKYYWYAGWKVPTAQNIATIVNDTYPAGKSSTTMNPAGKSATSISGVTMDYTKNTLYNSAAKTNYYVVVPNGQSIYDVLGTNVVSSQFANHSTFTNHTVYKSTATSRNINAIIIR